MYRIVVSAATDSLPNVMTVAFTVTITVTTAASTTTNITTTTTSTTMTTTAVAVAAGFACIEYVDGDDGSSASLQNHPLTSYSFVYFPNRYLLASNTFLSGIS